MRGAAALKAAIAPAARVSAIDQTRGLIIAFMAIDHVAGAIVRQHPVEFWNGAHTRYTDVLPFILRFLSHFCAPGFFFWMGCGVAMLAASRFEMGWSAWRIARFLALRGALIVAISQLIEFPLLALVFVTDANAPPGPAQLFILLGVLFALGACLVLAGILHRLPAAAWLALGAGLLVASNAVVPGPEQADAQFALWQRLLYLPGFAASVVSLYPVLPWFAITCLGVAFGKWTRRAPARAAGGALWIGLGAIASAVALRAAGGFGNITLPRDGSWIEFLNMVKYPPAVVFALWMVGGNLVFFAAFSRFRVAPLEVFGRAPLFFYIAHIALYAVTGALFFRRGATWSVGLPLWAASLVPLYYGCRWFDRFKRSKAPESFWRML